MKKIFKKAAAGMVAASIFMSGCSCLGIIDPAGVELGKRTRITSSIGSVITPTPKETLRIVEPTAQSIIYTPEPSKEEKESMYADNVVESPFDVAWLNVASNCGMKKYSIITDYETKENHWVFEEGDIQIVRNSEFIGRYEVRMKPKAVSDNKDESIKILSLLAAAIDVSQRDGVSIDEIENIWTNAVEGITNIFEQLSLGDEEVIGSIVDSVFCNGQVEDGITGLVFTLAN